MSDPDYGAIRLGADWASGVRNETIFFGYDGQAEQVELAQPGTSGTIPVFTFPSAENRSRVVGATVQLAEPPQGGGTPGTVTVDTTVASALFWSESAVEKFLLPYYVSAGGPEAYQVLHAINKVWYAYTEDTPVCALAFCYPSQGHLGQISLWDTVHVIHASGQELVRTKLLDYLQTQPPFQAAEFPLPTPSVPRIAASSDLPTLVDSLGAREVAEYVSGLRGNPVYVYGVDAPGGLFASLDDFRGGEDAPPLLFTALAEPVRPRRPAVTVTLDWVDLQGVSSTIQLQSLGDDRGKPNLANTPDCVFWTDGSVDMLMLPYYASVEGHWAPWYLMVLLGKWAGVTAAEVIDAIELLLRIVEDLGKLLLHHLRADVVGHPLGAALARLLGHGAGTGADGIAATLTTALGETTSEVYAIVHLPRSEYVDQPALEADVAERKDFAAAVQREGFRLENRTWLLTSSGNYPLVAPGTRLLPQGTLTA